MSKNTKGYILQNDFQTNNKVYEIYNGKCPNCGTYMEIDYEIYLGKGHPGNCLKCDKKIVVKRKKVSNKING